MKHEDIVPGYYACLLNMRRPLERVYVDDRGDRGAAEGRLFTVKLANGSTTVAPATCLTPWHEWIAADPAREKARLEREAKAKRIHLRNTARRVVATACIARLKDHGIDSYLGDDHDVCLSHGATEKLLARLDRTP